MIDNLIQFNMNMKDKMTNYMIYYMISYNNNKDDIAMLFDCKVDVTQLNYEEIKNDINVRSKILLDFKTLIDRRIKI